MAMAILFFSEFILSFVLGFGFLCLLGLLMEILIRPVHNKMWGYKHKKKPLTLHNLFFDGAGFIILHNWFWWIMFLFLFGIYILFYSIIKAQLLGIILGLIVTALGILKGYYFFEHPEVMKKRHSKRKNL